jgi:hypothetical protein
MFAFQLDEQIIYFYFVTESCVVFLSILADDTFLVRRF